MKKLALLLTIVLVAAIAVPAFTAPVQAQDKLRVAVVTPSTKSDLAFSQSIYDALIAVQEERGEENFEFVLSENMFVVEDAATALRDYASQGYDLVIAHGSQYGSSLLDIAPDFPDTAFAWGTTVDTYQDQGITNVYAYEARSEEGAFVQGVMAALLSESKVVGIIGPIETGDAKLYVDGFKAGVLWQDPEIEVLVNYIQSFSDLALAAAAAEAMLAEGADVLSGSAQMVPGAVNKAKEAGALWFGTQSNQTTLSPEIVVSSQVYNWVDVLNAIIADVEAGEINGVSFALTLENDGLLIEFNEDFELDEDVQEAAEEVMQAIIDGDISFEVDEEGVLTVVEAEAE
ncbi:MAG: BMP family protein [Anaerolineae bacterium]|nr:BMP family protein [Anaerolineae bacterium]MEB2287199.1 BMP family protein [Anaerolineae bacterium]